MTTNNKRIANDPNGVLHDAFCTFVDAGFAALASWLKQSSRQAVIDVDFVVTSTAETPKRLMLAPPQPHAAATTDEAAPHE